MVISLIWAQSANGAIGADGGLPWRVPEDMKRFRDLTMGGTVVMGRATWESLPARFRPLPGRRNVVVTRDSTYDAPGAEVVTSLDEAMTIDDDIWVGGGGQIYVAALGRADRICLTEIDADIDGDTFAPEIGADWIEVNRDPSSGWHQSTTGFRYRWRELRRG